VVEENAVTGNTYGIILGAGSRETVVRGNTVIGNPAIQVSISHPGVRAVDILNLAPQGQTTFERNVCLTAVNAPCPVLPTGRWRD
jgi:parallel beta-helix repeat protein